MYELTEAQNSAKQRYYSAIRDSRYFTLKTMTLYDFKVLMFRYKLNPNNLPKTGVDRYDIMYRSGFDIGFNAGLSGSLGDDIGAGAWSVASAASTGSDFGDIDYEMIWHSQGVRDGLVKGREARGY